MIIKEYTVNIRDAGEGVPNEWKLFQRPLVLDQLIEMVDSVDLERLEMGMEPIRFLKDVVKNVPNFLSIVLRDDHGIPADPATLGRNLEFGQLVEVITDFLSCNPSFSKCSEWGKALFPGAPQASIQTTATQ